eukprot:NODE_271_length_2529_cov_35.269359_g252_i0.p1 GENE.NODE_271_length_2529_cov_35.269359_g252_i0~~NODE_271_length_2529_cov_35.269359_g252_i0.p1  ORF type:complete len:816 (-),score=216.68 NODE_271_length_2529_cov_35.269359_g252_i0:82-2172(-)
MVSIKWYRVTGEEDILVSEQRSHYDIQPPDLGHVLKVSVTPVLPNGTNGMPVTCLTAPVAPNDYMLRINVIKGRSLKDTDILGKGDPFVELALVFQRDKQEFKTKVHANGGSAPEWNETTIMHLKDQDSVLEVNVYDKDKIGKDLIGSAKINIADLQLGPGVQDTYWVPLTNKAKHAGKIQMALHRFPRVKMLNGLPPPPIATATTMAGTLRNLHIGGELAVDSTVTAEYDSSHDVHFNWFRLDADGKSTPLSTTKPSIKLTSKEFGHHILLTAQELGPLGQVLVDQEFKSTANVVVAPPKITKCELHGDPEEGQILTAVVQAEYYGMEGKQTIEWYRDEIPMDDQKDKLKYKISKTDVGKTIKLCATPVNNQQISGAPLWAATPTPVESSTPVVRNVSIQGTPFCGKTLKVNYDYKGGKEGKSLLVWEISDVGKKWVAFHKTEKAGAPLPGGLPKSSKDSLYLTADHLHCFVRCVVTPVRAGGPPGTDPGIPVNSPARRVRLDPEHREELQNMLVSGDASFELREGNGENLHLNLSLKTLTVLTSSKVPKAKQDWGPVEVSSTSAGGDYRGLHLKVGAAEFRGKPLTKPELHTFALRAFQTLATKEQCGELLSKKMQEEWRKGHLKSAYEQKQKGKAKGEKQIQAFIAELARSQKPIAANIDDLTSAERDAIEAAKNVGPQRLMAHALFAALGQQ